MPRYKDAFERLGKFTRKLEKEIQEDLAREHESRSAAAEKGNAKTKPEAEAAKAQYTASLEAEREALRDKLEELRDENAMLRAEIADMEKLVDMVGVLAEEPAPKPKPGPKPKARPKPKPRSKKITGVAIDRNGHPDGYTLSKQELAHTVRMMGSVAGRTGESVLAWVVFDESQKGSRTSQIIKATDNRTAIITRARKDNIIAGNSIAIDIDEFGSLVPGPDGVVLLPDTDNIIKIHGAADLSVHGYDPRPFPQVGFDDSGVTVFTGDFEAFRSAIIQHKAIQGGQQQAAMQGLDKLRIDDGHIVSTDTVRLLVTKVTGLATGSDPFCLPRDVLRTFKTLPKGPIDFDLRLTENELIATMDYSDDYTVQLATKQAESSFPAWRKIMGDYEKTHHWLTLAVDEWLSAIESVMPIAKQSGNKIQLNIAGDSVALSAQAHGGRVARHASISGYTHDDIELAYNGKLVTDYLKQHKGERIKMGVLSSIHASVFCPESNNDSTYLLMPINI